MKTVPLQSWQKEAIKEGHNKVVVGDEIEIKVNENFKLEGKEKVATHVQPVGSGYLYSFPNVVNGKKMNTTKTINAPSYIIQFEEMKNDTSGKAGKAKELVDKS